MPIKTWCWRCRRDVMMITDEEWPSIGQHVASYVHELRARQQELGIARSRDLLATGWLPTVLQRYKDVTGQHETNINAIWHHIRSEYGPDCKYCGRALRTPTLRYCYECRRQQDDEPETGPAPADPS